ncbi:MAG: hypothetical protein AB7Y46_19615 [Armatimonadota bacterium]
MASWQTRPVFVSSTFRDMQSERDWLRERGLQQQRGDAQGIIDRARTEGATTSSSRRPRSG